MLSRPRSTFRIGVAVALLAATAVLPACGASGPGGTTITMPVLWAGPDGGGGIQSGIERAKVTVGARSGAQFDLDLNGIEAKQAGPQWRAATASAAAVATFASARDPAEIDIAYSITGPIDGPSGGALLTVGTLAAIRGDELATDITMTGTISPDSTIGRVGDIPAKLRAASKAGYRTVLLPTANLVASGDPSTTDMIAFGRSLGLDVRGVDVLAQAYEAFTGIRLGGVDPVRPPLSTPVRDVARATTTALLDRLATESAAAAIVGPESVIVATDLAGARSAFTTGDLARAYGLGVDGYTVLQRAIGAMRTQTRISTLGMDATRDAMRADVAALRARAAVALQEGSQVASADAVAQLSTPFALGWATYSDALLAGIETGLADGSITTAGYTASGAAIEEQRASIEVFQSDAIAMARSAPNPTITTAQPTARFLSGYTDFLVRAGQANAEYYAAVVARNRLPRVDSKGNPVFNVLALEALGTVAERIPSAEQELDDEIRQSALAITYFVIGTGLVSNTSDKGIAGSAIGLDAVSTVDSPGLVASVEEGARLADGYAQALAGRSIDPGAFDWSTRWGVATARALNGSGRDATGEVIAQNELWYSVVGMSALWAATSP